MHKVDTKKILIMLGTRTSMALPADDVKALCEAYNRKPCTCPTKAE